MTGSDPGARPALLVSPERLSAPHWSSVAFAVSSALLGLFLVLNHAFASMWLEGFGEMAGTLLAMFRLDQHVPSCWVRIGGAALPLGMNPYTGPAWYYLMEPPAALWFGGHTADPYVYRYATVLVFLVNGWLLFLLLSRHYARPLAFLTATAFMTTPTVLLGALTEHGAGQLVFLAPLLSALFVSLYLTSGRLVHLTFAAFSLGLALLTRAESLVWFVLPGTLYLLLAVPGFVNRLKAQPRKATSLLLALGAFALGSAPWIAFNLFCSDGGLLTFFKARLLPRTLDSSSLTLPAKILTRLSQFWSIDLLNKWTLWELHTPNVVLAFLAVASVGALLVRWIRGGGPSLPLLVLLTGIPFSIIIPSHLREEHLMVLQPCVAPLILAGLLALGGASRARALAPVALTLLVVGNIVVSARDWLYWTHIPPTRQTMLNQSDPLLLGKYLEDHHRNDRILYTNIGMPQYVQYATAGSVKGDDISSWGSAEGFADSVRLALLDGSARRVFVAVGEERDGGASFILPRTRLLYQLLDTYRIEYGKTRLRSPRNPYLYDIVVVERGRALDAEQTAPDSFFVSQVRDVRIQDAPGGERLVMGSVHGIGFRRSDVVVIDGRPVRTAFGNEKWLTFSVPFEAFGGVQRPFQLAVVRAGDLQRTKPFDVAPAGWAGR